MPGKIEGRQTQFLLDPGSTENILSRHLVDRLSQQIRDQLKPQDLNAHHADWSNLIIYGTLEFSCCICTIPIATTFKIVNITDYVILVMQLTKEYQGSLHLVQKALQTGKQVIPCVDCTG